MPNKIDKYYFLDIDVIQLKVVDYGEADTANLTGETPEPNVHRVFLTKGQFNKLKQSLVQGGGGRSRSRP